MFEWRLGIGTDDEKVDGSELVYEGFERIIVAPAPLDVRSLASRKLSKSLFPLR
jgi:hypothetical protein